MSRKEKNDIEAMVKVAKELAESDPQAFMIVKSNIDILKARSDMDKANQKASECQLDFLDENGIRTGKETAVTEAG